MALACEAVKLLPFSIGECFEASVTTAAPYCLWHLVDFD